MQRGVHSQLSLLAQISGAVVFCMLLGAPTLASAAGVVSVRPAKIESSVRPGGSDTREVRVGNTTDTPISVHITFEDGATAEDPRDSMGLLGDQDGAFPIRELLSTPAASYTVPAGVEISIPVTIRVPLGAEAGGRYGSVILTARPAASANTPANVAIETRLAVLLFLRIEGETTEEGKLESFGVVGGKRLVRAPSPDAPLPLFLTFANSGDVHLNPYGDIAIEPLFGDTITHRIDPWAVLPGSVRSREIPIIGTLAPGPHVVTLSLNRGYDDVIDTAVTRIWVLPTPAMSAGLVAVLAIILFVLYRSIRLSRNSIRT